MEKKKSKVNLILSIVSFSITALLLVMVSMAWYATNKKANVNSVLGRTAGTDYNLALQRGTYSQGSWTWADTNNLSITNLQPGDVYFFRFKIEYDSQVKFETTFSEISSALVENDLIVFTSGGRSYVQINGTGQNWLEASGNAVSIVEVVNGVNQSPKQLYSTAGGVVSLQTTAYRVADTFKLYDYGLGNQTFSADAIIQASDQKEDGSGAITSTLLTSNAAIEYDLSTLASASGDAYGYFALEFNDALSIKNYIHLDGTTSSDSNLYQSQTLTIGAIGLRDITEG